MSGARSASVVKRPGEFSRVVAREISPQDMSLVMACPSCCGVLVLFGGCDCGSAGLCSWDHWPCWYCSNRWLIVCVRVRSLGLLVPLWLWLGHLLLQYKHQHH